jgi:hypothetical protein
MVSLTIRSCGGPQPLGPLRRTYVTGFGSDDPDKGLENEMPELPG